MGIAWACTLPLNNSTTRLMRVRKFCAVPLTMSGECVSNATSLFHDIWFQSDNTVAQAKNQYVARFLALLVSRRLFLSVNLVFLIVGYAHEGIDQLFGVVVSLILQLGTFERIVEFMESLLEKLRTKFAAKQELVSYTCLTAIRDFSRWSSALQCAIWNCWANREGQEAPRAFMFKQRRVLGTLEKAWLGATRREGIARARGPSEREDVYCCMKTYMRDTIHNKPLCFCCHLRARSN
jgi:hypothetical protein